MKFKRQPIEVQMTLKKRIKLAERDRQHDRRIRRELRQDYGSVVVNLNTTS